MNDSDLKLVKRAEPFFVETNDAPVMNLRGGVTDLFLLSANGIGYHVSMTNTGAAVIRSERSRRTFSYSIDDLVTMAIEQGIDKVQP